MYQNMVNKSKWKKWKNTKINEKKVYQFREREEVFNKKNWV